MRYRKLDLNLLAALEELLDTASVTRAADRLNLSQAAMSNALARLRAHFNDPLLVRSGRRMLLTERARAIRGEVSEVLRRIETRILATPDFDPAEKSRRFTLQAADSVTPGLLSALGRTLHRTAPGLHLTIRPLVEDPGLALDRGDADLLLIPRQYAAPDHPIRPLCSEPFHVIAWAQSPLASRDLTAEAYLQAEHVVVELGPQRKIPVDRAIIEHGHGRLRAPITLTSQLLVPWHVVGTDRLGTLPASLAQSFCAVLPLIARPLPLPVPPLHLVLQWSRLAEDDAALAWLRQQLVDQTTHSQT